MARRRRRNQEDEEGEDEDDCGEVIDRAKRRMVENFFDDQAEVDDDGEEEDDGSAEEDFIVQDDIEIDNECVPRRVHRRPLLPLEDDHDDIEALERRILQKYHSSENYMEDEGSTDVDQQALLPSVRDPKLWMVKCAIGHEREVVACLMQKCISEGSQLQIMSAIALDHLKNFIYIEAEKEAHVKEACKGMRNIYMASKILLVPVKEMTDILSVQSKKLDLCRGTWVRMTIGTYKGDLAKVVDLDDVRRRVTVKLIPRIDLQSLANKLEGIEISKKKMIAPRLLNLDEARALNIRVERRRNRATGDYFDNVNGMMFKDGFLYKNASMKSVSTVNIQPSFDELERFRESSEKSGGSNTGIVSMPSSNRNDVHFSNGDRVSITKGDLKNLNGWVEKVDEDIVHIKPNATGLPKSIAVNRKEVCKYIEPGNRVKVITGATEGTTGMVVMVQGNMVKIVSDQTNETLPVPINNVAEFETPIGVLQCSGKLSRGGLASTGGRNRVWMRPNSLIGTCIKVHAGPFKGYKGRVVDVKGSSVRVELESQMKVVTVDRSCISDKMNVSTPYSDTPRYGSGSETPMRYSSSMTPQGGHGSGSETPMHHFSSLTPRGWHGSGSETPMQHLATPRGEHGSGRETPMHHSSPSPQGACLESSSPEVGINAY